MCTEAEGWLCIPVWQIGFYVTSKLLVFVWNFVQHNKEGILKGGSTGGAERKRKRKQREKGREINVDRIRERG